MPPKPQFFCRMDRLATLIARHDESPSVFGEIQELLGDPDVRREFFNTLQSPEWISLLWRQGYFNDPPPIRQEDGADIGYPTWPESAYLARMAPVAPAEVAAIFRAVETNNPSVIGNMVKAALSMPANVASLLVPAICRAAKEGTLWIYFKDASDLCVRLAEGNELDPAVTLTVALFTPTFELGHGGRRRRDEYWYKKGLERVVPALAPIKPNEFLPKLCDWLIASVDAKQQVDVESGADYSYIWRPAIEEHEQNREYDFASVMVGFVRKGFEQAIRSKALSLDEAIRIVECYPYLIFKRIRLHLIGEFADENSDLVRQTILNRELFDDYEYRHEYATLVGRRLDLLSHQERDEWFSWVDAGPNMSDAEEFMRESRGREPTEDDRQEWIHDWQFEKLHWVRTHLEGERRDFYDRMLTAHGEPELADVNVRISSGWVGGDSPMTVDELAQMPFEQAVDAVSSWRPAGSSFTGPSITGLASTFEQYVATNPAEFSKAARTLVNRPPIFVRGFINQMNETVNLGGEVSLEAVLELCDWVVNRPVEDRTVLRQPHEVLVDENWQWTRDGISRLIESVCKAESGSVPTYPLGGLRASMWRLIARLCRDRPDSYIVYDASAEDPRVRDYLDLGINSPRGKAVEAALEYARWVAKHTKVSDGKREIVPNGFDGMPEVREMLEWQIAPENRSFEAMAVIGSRIGVIYWIDKMWLAEIAAQLFSLEDIERSPGAAHGWAAWNAFLVWGQPHIEFYQIFRSQFSAAVGYAANVALTERTREEPLHRLGEHLIVLYGRGQLGLDDDEHLLRRFLEHANPEVRRHAISFVGQSLEGEQTLPADVVGRFQRLWDLYWGGPGRKDAADSPNGWLFGTWFSCGKFPDTWALDRLLEFVKVAPNPEPDHDIVRELAEIAHIDIGKAVEVLDRMVRGDRESWRIHGYQDSAKQILRLALTDPGEARETAEELIDYLGRRGYTEFGQLLSSPRPSR